MFLSAVLRGLKGNDTAEDGNRHPGSDGSAGRAQSSPCAHARPPPEALPQQLFHETRGDLLNFSSQGKKRARNFSSFPEILACGDPTSLCHWSSRDEQGLCLLPWEVWAPQRQGVLPGSLTMPSEQLERGLEASDSPL